MAWVLQEVGTILWQFGTFETEEEAQDRKESLSYFGDLIDVVELDEDDQINTEHINDR